MRRQGVRRAGSVVRGLHLLGAGAGEAAGESGYFLADLPAAGSFSGYQMRGQGQDPSLASGKLQALSEVLLGRSVHPGQLRATWQAAMNRAPDRPVDTPLTDDPAVAVGYDRVSRFWAINGRVTRDTSEGALDVGRAGAQRRFEATMAELVSKGAVRPDDYDLRDVRFGAVRAGYGRSDVGAQREWTKEYRFAVPRKIDGVEVYDAGVTVSVHRTGALASISVSGPVVERASRVPAPHHVQPAALDARFLAEFPGRTITFSGIRYVHLADGLVKPRQMYRFASMITGPDGVAKPSRAMNVSYSLEDAAAPRIEWPSYDPTKLAGDSRPEP
jgi:hypothetical protein